MLFIAAETGGDNKIAANKQSKTNTKSEIHAYVVKVFVFRKLY